VDRLYEPLDRGRLCGPDYIPWELTGGVVSGDGCGGARVLAAAPTVSLDGEVADDVRLSEAVLGMFSSTSSASWSYGYGQMEWRWRR
jgi:hypothetical protein